MRFQVPQFTEIEDKIFGPFTLKQFIYLIGGAGGVFILYALLPLYLMIPLAIPVGLFSMALAFYKVNNQPFIKVVENAFYYITSSKLYLWKKQEVKVKPAEEEKPEEKRQTPLYMPKLTKTKLSDLAWSLDIKEKLSR
ncbi:MAG: PrgI family protein [bacterium]|nr:PrgI family protein [bacterium]